MAAPLPPEENIGPVWRVFGFIAFAIAIALLVVKLLASGSIQWVDFAVFAVLMFVSLGLIRPKLLDKLIKTAGDALPFFKYEKPRDPPVESKE